MFHVIQDAYAIVRNRAGVYKQVKVYRYNGGLYIGAKGGFCRLMKGGDVATPDMSYVELWLPNCVKQTHDECGRLTCQIYDPS